MINNMIEMENNNSNATSATTESTNKRKTREKSKPLMHYYSENPASIEIGIDEVGRGPLFGRVYTAAVVLPKDDSFDHFKMKDSKKFHSKKKIQEIAEYIKEHAINWSISYEDEQVIDDINILQATQQAMHKCIHQIIKKDKDMTDANVPLSTYKLLVDGNYFKPYTMYNPVKKMIEEIDYVCIEGGDNKYSAIAAASIIAKVARDQYIEDLCKENPSLVEYYSIDSNKGYGAQKHINGIKQHGITIWHRRSFGICKEYVN